MDKKLDKNIMNTMSGSPSSNAKKDVLLALRKMAMEMMSEGHGADDHPAGVMAKIDVKKLSPEMGDEVESLPGMDDAQEESSESDEDKIAELEAQLQELKAKKQLA